MQITITPNYPDTVKAHALKMAQPNNDIPSQEDGNVWNTIKELAPNWLARKKQGISHPGYPVNYKDYWTVFSYNCKPSQFPQLDAFINDTFPIGKTFIEIGSGRGFYTAKLLESGWSGIVVDPCSSALEILANNNQTYADQLTRVCKKITHFIPEEPVDLVVCKDTFNYINPSKFQTVWENIFHRFLKKDGMLFGTLFVNNPDHSKLKTINQYKELGAWLIPDSRFIKPLLEDTGYTIIKTTSSTSWIVQQFSAKK